MTILHDNFSFRVTTEPIVWQLSLGTTMSASLIGLGVKRFQTIHHCGVDVPRTFSRAIALDSSNWRWINSIRSFWLRNVFTCTGRSNPHAMPRALVDLRLQHPQHMPAQITGKPTWARALQSYGDSGPASNPIRLKW